MTGAAASSPPPTQHVRRHFHLAPSFIHTSDKDALQQKIARKKAAAEAKAKADELTERRTKLKGNS